MKTYRGKRIVASGLILTGLLSSDTVSAQDITAIENGFPTLTNSNPDLHYTVEFRPNLSGPEARDGSYRDLRDLRSSEAGISVPVGIKNENNTPARDDGRLDLLFQTF